MAKHKFTYNKQTLQYEQYVMSAKDKAVRFFKYFSASAVGALILLALFYKIFPSPREKQLLIEIETLEHEFEAIHKDVEQMGGQLKTVVDRDADVYRTIFGMEPLNRPTLQSGISVSLATGKMEDLKHSQYTVSTLRDKVGQLKAQLAQQTASLDTIRGLAVNKEKMMASIPSIKPVREDNLNRAIQLMSGFGWRIHPIHKVQKFHKGTDFAAPQGTHIQSTGDGTVVKVEHNAGGYGNNVTIDHGFGYKTLYAHMHVIDVKQGQLVKKGQRIGLVGDTGTSTAPHLHYEVHLRGEPVNPLPYCLDGLTPAEYQQVVAAAESSNQSFD